MNKLKKGDKVKVIAGRDLGKTGEVMKVLYEKYGKKKLAFKAVVKGINMVKRSQKPNPRINLPGGIFEFEKPIAISNLMLMIDDKVARVGIKIDDKTKKKERILKK